MLRPSALRPHERSRWECLRYPRGEACVSCLQRRSGRHCPRLPPPESGCLSDRERGSHPADCRGRRGGEPRFRRGLLVGAALHPQATLSRHRQRNSSPAMPVSATGVRSGNSAISERFPPIASTVFQSVARKNCLSSRETTACLPSLSAIKPMSNAYRRKIGSYQRFRGPDRQTSIFSSASAAASLGRVLSARVSNSGQAAPDATQPATAALNSRRVARFPSRLDHRHWLQRLPTRPEYPEPWRRFHRSGRSVLFVDGVDNP